MNRFNQTILATTIAATGLAGFATAANAATTTVASKSATVSDCNLYTSVKINGGVISGFGAVSCTHSHSTLNAKVELKLNGTTAKVGTITGSYNPLMGTVNAYGQYQLSVGQCVTAQAVLSWNVSGIGTGYITTGTPKTICGS